MNDLKTLADYPRLAQWYEKYQMNAPDPTNYSVRLLWSICRALTLDLEPRLRVWMQSLEHFFRHAPDPRNQFLDVEQAFQDAECDFFVLASELAEVAMHSGKGESFRHLMTDIADRSELTVFRFFSAWAALNTGDLEFCIDECEKVVDPFACVYTLQGQAFLELGMVNEAIDALTSAVKISPQETLAHFQLAKAYFTVDKFEESWSALDQCEAQSNNHPEIVAFRAMVILRMGLSDHRNERMSTLVPQLLNAYWGDTHNTDLLLLNLDLIFTADSKSGFQELIEKAPWNLIKTSMGFMQQLAPILRELDRKGWRKEAAEFMKALSPENITAV